MDKHEIFMRKALEEARLAEEEGEIPVGAVVVCKGRVIARAHNQTERLNDVTAHAEMLAITSATSLFTLEPCVMCGGALAWAQLGELVYGAADPHRGYARLSPSVLHPKTNVVTGVLENECGELVKNFFAKKR